MVQLRLSAGQRWVLDGQAEQLTCFTGTGRRGREGALCCRQMETHTVQGEWHYDNEHGLGVCGSYENAFNHGQLHGLGFMKLHHWQLLSPMTGIGRVVECRVTNFIVTKWGGVENAGGVVWPPLLTAGEESRQDRAFTRTWTCSSWGGARRGCWGGHHRKRW